MDSNFMNLHKGNYVPVALVDPSANSASTDLLPFRHLEHDASFWHLEQMRQRIVRTYF